MTGPIFDAAERSHLSDLLDELGPEAPTLLAPWTTRDMAAHLVLRERDPWPAPGWSCPVHGAAWRNDVDERSRCGTSPGSSRRSGPDRRPACSAADGCAGSRA